MEKGWLDSEGERYYLDPKTGVAAVGFKTISGVTYYFNEKGQLQHLLQKIGDNYYFFGRYSGKMEKGWLDSEGERYYLDPKTGIAATNWSIIENKKYYFNEKGQLYRSLQTVDNQIYYFDDDSGELKYGWIDNGKDKYYSDKKTGIILTGLVEIDNEKYFFNEKGQLQHLLQKIGDNYYFFGRYSGKMQYGWLSSENKMYYLDPNDGHAYIGKQTIDGVDYTFRDDATLISQFITKNNKTYYIYSDGSYAKDWSWIAGSKYFFNSLGEMIAKDAKFVIDVSTHQKEIDWDAVKRENKVDGVILRVGYGSFYEDAQLANNITNLKRLGIPYGLYIFSYAENTTEAYNEANGMLSMIEKYQMNPTLGIYYDIEDWDLGYANSSNISKSMYDNIITTFINRLNSKGYSANVYTGLNFANNRLSSKARQYVTWIAQYAHNCTYTGSYNIWQYSSNETVSGINTNVDGNVLFKK